MRRARFTTTPGRAFAGRGAPRRLASRRARVLEIVRHLVARRWRAALALAMARSQAWSGTPTRRRGRRRPWACFLPYAASRMQEAAGGRRRQPQDPAPPDIRGAWKLEGKVGCTSAGAGRFFSENPYEMPSRLLVRVPQRQTLTWIRLAAHRRLTTCHQPLQNTHSLPSL